MLSVAPSAQCQALLRGQVTPLAVLGSRRLGREQQLVLDVQLDGLRRRQLLLLQKLEGWLGYVRLMVATVARYLANGVCGSASQVVEHFL